MKGEQTENGEDSANLVSAKDDGTATNITSNMTSDVDTNPPLLCEGQIRTKNQII